MKVYLARSNNDRLYEARPLGNRSRSITYQYTHAHAHVPMCITIIDVW
jgi:hypothetical protein